MHSLQTNRSLEVGLSPVPRGRGLLFPMLADWGSLESLATPPAPHEMSVSIREPRVVLDVAGKKINFLIDTGASYPVLLSHAGPLSSKSCSDWCW